MNSFLNLFNFNSSDSKCKKQIYEDYEKHILPPEPQSGNIEYKLKIVSPSKQRFEHLVTQMKWRLCEGQGEAVYEIGVEDNGKLTGISHSDMNESLTTLERMASELGASTKILRERKLDNGKLISEVLVRKITDDKNTDIRIAVMGSADAGKSTLIGVLIEGKLDNGHGKARLNIFRHLHEIKSGRTSSISHEFIGFNRNGEIINHNSTSLTTPEEICDNSAKLVTFLDLAGHKKFLRTTIQGLSGYLPHYAMLVISGTSGIVNMTYEHLNIALALKVPFFIVITKTDLISPDKTIRKLHIVLENLQQSILLIKDEQEFVSTGNAIPVFCLSNVSGNGLNLLTKFLYHLPYNKDEQLENQPCEFQIDETFLVCDVGQIVGGLLIKGVVREGSKLCIGPLMDGSFRPVTVQSIHRNKVKCRVVRAGQSAAMKLDCDVENLRRGMILLPFGTAASGCFYFQATVYMLYHATAIHPGFQTTIYIGSIRQTVVMEEIMTPNGIQMHKSSSVLFKFISQPEYLQVGNRLLFQEGKTRGVGKITEVFPLSSFKK